MYEILAIEDLTPVTKRYEIRAPDVAHKARAGQFVIIRIHERGERIPLAIADYDRDGGTITLVVQEVSGKTLFACVDGPEFDGHQVDWERTMARQSIYLEEERQAMEAWRCAVDARQATNTPSS